MLNDKVKQFFDIKSLHWDERKTRPIEVYDDFAKRNFYIKEGDKVLDLGCGSGTFVPSIYKCSKAPVIGMDISTGMIKLAKEKFVDDPNVTFVEQDFYDSTLKDIDVIVCHNAYSHFPYVSEFVDKCAEVLKPGGILAITHFIDISKLNGRHKGMNECVAREVLSASEEAKHFLTKFELIKASDDPEYLIILKRKIN